MIDTLYVMLEVFLWSCVWIVDTIFDTIIWVDRLALIDQAVLAMMLMGAYVILRGVWTIIAAVIWRKRRGLGLWSN